ncbi:MAG: hypothetical protein RIB03_00485 [Henriciella sp.]|uniref:hypothetical protein n=1 Tax=Henriciella sp. TaxID=1968823 RepID=UPI0032EE12B1
MKQARHWIAIALLVLVVVFAIQNMAAISVNFLGFEFATSRIVLMVICVLIGFGLGKTIHFRRLGK